MSDAPRLSPRLSSRLAALAAHVPPGARLADIGTDHALLPVALARAGRVADAVAIDVRPGAVAQALRTVTRHGVADRVVVRLGDGLTAVRPGEADVAVISGLGGPAIVRILGAEHAIAGELRRLILAPQSATWRVRRWLMGSGWDVVAEQLVAHDGRSYEIIVAEPGDGRAGYRRPGRPAAWTIPVLWQIGPCLARAADGAWRVHWLRAADGMDARAVAALAGGTPAAERAAGRWARRAARIRRAVAAASAAEWTTGRR